MKNTQGSLIGKQVVEINGVPTLVKKPRWRSKHSKGEKYKHNNPAQQYAHSSRNSGGSSLDKTIGTQPGVGADSHVDRGSVSVRRLIEHANNTPMRWLIDDLWQVDGIAVLHSLEGNFKSVAAFQIAESIALGAPLFRHFRVSQARCAAVFETEMDDLEVGNRLKAMYENKGAPALLEVSNNELIKQFRRADKLSGKMEVLDGWLKSIKAQVLVWDTVNSALAAAGDPNSERSVSAFFDALALLPVSSVLMVRHDGKPTKDTNMRAPNQRVRGSNRIVEDASTVIHLDREGNSSDVRFDVGKLRNGPRPEPMTLWFDSGEFRLTPVPPLVRLLESGPQTRTQYIEQGFRRFNLKIRSMDEMRGRLNECLIHEQRGHEVIVSLNPQYEPTDDSEIGRWWKYVRIP